MNNTYRPSFTPSPRPVQVRIATPQARPAIPQQRPNVPVTRAPSTMVKQGPVRLATQNFKPSAKSVQLSKANVKSMPPPPKASAKVLAQPPKTSAYKTPAQPPKAGTKVPVQAKAKSVAPPPKGSGGRKFPQPLKGLGAIRYASSKPGAVKPPPFSAHRGLAHDRSRQHTVDLNPTSQSASPMEWHQGPLVPSFTSPSASDDQVMQPPIVNPMEWHQAPPLPVTAPPSNYQVPAPPPLKADPASSAVPFTPSNAEPSYLPFGYSHNDPTGERFLRDNWSWIRSLPGLSAVAPLYDAVFATEKIINEIKKLQKDAREGKPLDTTTLINLLSDALALAGRAKDLGDQVSSKQTDPEGEQRESTAAPPAGSNVPPPPTASNVPPPPGVNVPPPPPTASNVPPPPGVNVPPQPPPTASNVSPQTQPNSSPTRSFWPQSRLNTMNIQGGAQTRADQLQALVTQIARRYPNQSIMVGGATADVNGRPLTIVQVSNRGPYLELHRNPEILAQFARDSRLNPSEVRLALCEPSKNNSHKLWGQGHVERVAVQSLQATGAREGIATASGQACEGCTGVWLRGRQFPNWVHLLVPE